MDGWLSDCTYSKNTCGSINRCKYLNVKNVKMFPGKESDVDWACETLLTNLSTTVAQLELSERGPCLALLSKLTDIGLQAECQRAE